jgi:hypothetical protein
LHWNFPAFFGLETKVLEKALILLNFLIKLTVVLNFLLDILSRKFHANYSGFGTVSHQSKIGFSIYFAKKSD